MNEPEPVPTSAAPPKQRPSGCLLLVLCIVSAALLIFGGCCIIVSSDFAKSMDDWLLLGIPSVLIFVVGLLCARGAWRMHRRWKAAKPPG